jgi:hypothetical protein
MFAHEERSGVERGSFSTRPPVKRLRVSRGWVADAAGSPPEGKLALLERALGRFGDRLVPLTPSSLTLADVVRVHDDAYVRGVLDGPPPSQPVGQPMPTGGGWLDELGACHAAAVAALEDGVGAALTCGAQDAFWDSPGRTCPFNGWMVAAARLLADAAVRRVAIIDCTSQCGSGTQSIIDRLGLGSSIRFVAFGRRYQFRRQAQLYLARVRILESDLLAFDPDLILYQAAAGSHVLGPVGGVLGTDQLRRRDATVFGTAWRLGVPVAWNVDGEGPAAPPLDVAVDVHLNTFHEAWRTFGSEWIADSEQRLR